MKQSRVIALGFFDGVHLGHGQLLLWCCQEAERLGVQAAAVTFDRHPASALSGKSIPLLSDPEERKRIMAEQYGIDQLITIPFDREMMTMPWENFLRDVLVNELGAVSLVCGHDYRFGSGGIGNAQRLKAGAGALGIDCHVIPAYQLHGVTVSSTHIRSLIQAGDMEGAGEFLGHPYTLTGRVVPGRGLGRTMGVPTANLELSPNRLLPPHGVYATRALTSQGDYLAVTNVGSRPTVGGHHVTIEPWLLDYAGDLYGQTVTLELHKFLRPEKKFQDLEALREEILRNANQTKAYFAAR